MCQATVYLNEEEIMQDVLKVQLVPEGVRLSRLFEAPQVVQATIREIDLIKHRVMLESLTEPEKTP
ncbi:MAG: CooT family nickel-binding protein [Chloroflexota bacterium]|nr:CooT family nickel-binding protein [Chloroflexota bacterium]